MGPLGHTAVSSAVGVGVGMATGSPEAGALTLGFGVLMDVDHLYDIYRWYVKGQSNRAYILFHAWEYSVAGLVVLAAVYFHPLLLAAVAAHFAHVATDHFHNGLSRFAYFITYRVVKGFDRADIAPGENVMYSHRAWSAMLPLGPGLRRWIQRRIEPWFEVRANRWVGDRSGHPPFED